MREHMRDLQRHKKKNLAIGEVIADRNAIIARQFEQELMEENGPIDSQQSESQSQLDNSKALCLSSNLDSFDQGMLQGLTQLDGTGHEEGS